MSDKFIHITHDKHIKEHKKGNQARRAMYVIYLLMNSLASWEWDKRQTNIWRMHSLALKEMTAHTLIIMWQMDLTDHDPMKLLLTSGRVS